MELTGERHLPASRQATWAALDDPATLQACIAGCESLERVGEDGFAAVVAVRVGPVSARFKGSLKMLDIRPPDGCTLQFEGQGGAAGFGKGSAEVVLADDGAGTLLRYTARAQVGGKMAQIGSRLVDAAAAKIADDFFAAFEAHLAAASPASATDAAEPAASVPPEVSSETGIRAMGPAASVPSEASPSAGVRAAPATEAGANRWGWFIGAALAVVVGAVVFEMTR